MKNKLLVLAFFEGFFLVAIELFYTQLLQPFYGGTYFVWVSMLSVTMLSSALGYFLGSWVQNWKNKSRTKYILIVSLMLAIFLMVIFQLSELMFNVLNEYSFLNALFLHTSVVIFVPILFLTSFSPLLVKYFSATQIKSGKSAGNIFFISTIGGVVSIYSIAFFFLPNYDLLDVIMAFSILSIVINIVLVVNLIGIKILMLELLVLFIIFIGIKNKNVEKVKGGNTNIIYREHGIMGLLEVRDRNDKRFLTVNRTTQSGINHKTGKPLWKYPLRIATYASLAPANGDILIAGLGGGILVNQLSYLGYNINVVEFDERIYDVSKKYMRMNEDFEFEVDDFRHYINKSNKKYDVIILDLSKGEAIPSNVYSLESFKKISELLKPDGYVILHFFSDIYGTAGTVYSSILKTIEKSGMFFATIRKYEDDGSIEKVVVASNNPQIIKGRNYKIPIDLLDRAGIVYENIFEKNTDYSNGVLFTDDKSALLDVTQFSVVKDIREKLRENEYNTFYKK